MAITPIDLQTLFTQLDKVGKAHAFKEGQVLQQAVLSDQIQKKAEEHIQQVNEAQNTGEGTEKVNDNSKREQGEGRKREKGRKGQADEEEKTSSVLYDPSLGRNIDISL